MFLKVEAVINPIIHVNLLAATSDTFSIKILASKQKYVMVAKIWFKILKALMALENICKINFWGVSRDSYN